jgi:coenzyme F420-reducing hydrogenase alpha subunit
MFFLAAPDYLGLDDGIALARLHRSEVERGLRLRKLGNRILELLGGRPVNPVGACVGGFTRIPTRAELADLGEDIVRGRGEAEAALRFFASLPVPSRPQPIEFVSLRHPREYPMNEGRIHSSAGLDLPVSRFLEAFEESQVPHSTALHCRRRGGGTYLVGPLARVWLNADRLLPGAAAAFEALAPRFTMPDPCTSVFARGIEVMYALEEALRVIRAFEPPPAPFATWEPRAGVGHGATEAPRGTLYVRLETDDRGDVVAIRIIPPTSQNQARIEEDLRGLVPSLLALSHDEARRACEAAIRNYDPCISCSTHFLTLEIERVTGSPPTDGGGACGSG